MILLLIFSLFYDNKIFCIEIEPSGCEKVESKQHGNLDTFISDNYNPMCKGPLRFKKNDKVYCLQIENSKDDYFECPVGKIEVGGASELQSGMTD